MIAASWSEARSLGLPTYFTGEKCSRGHISERRAGNADCVMCARNRMATWARENPDRANAHSAEWAKRNPDKVKERVRQWGADNPEANARKAKRYRERHPEKVKERARRYVSDNPDVFRAANARRRARKKNAPGSYTAAEAQGLLGAQNHICARCRCNLKQAPRHLDHIIPLSRGGSNFIENMQWLCRTCNVRKHNKLPSELPQLEAQVPV
jgi:5-methylcytosine-specific restriction endonuclease McrA